MKRKFLFVAVAAVALCGLFLFCDIDKDKESLSWAMALDIPINQDLSLVVTEVVDDDIIIEECVRQGFSTDECGELQDLYDKWKDGTLDIEEAKDILRRLGYDIDDGIDAQILCVIERRCWPCEDGEDECEAKLDSYIDDWSRHRITDEQLKAKLRDEFGFDLDVVLPPPRTPPAKSMRGMIDPIVSDDPQDILSEEVPIDSAMRSKMLKFEDVAAGYHVTINNSQNWLGFVIYAIIAPRDRVCKFSGYKRLLDMTVEEAHDLITDYTYKELLDDCGYISIFDSSGLYIRRNGTAIDSTDKEFERAVGNIVMDNPTLAWRWIAKPDPVRIGDALSGGNTLSVGMRFKFKIRGTTNIDSLMATF